MRNLLSATLLICTALPAAASEDCEALGLGSVFLTDHFCAQLEALRDIKPLTRSIVAEGDPDELPADAWASLGLIQDAYRADPRKTLELIERIKGAGGLQPIGN